MKKIKFRCEASRTGARALVRARTVLWLSVVVHVVVVIRLRYATRPPAAALHPCLSTLVAPWPVRGESAPSMAASPSPIGGRLLDAISLSDSDADVDESVVCT